MANNSKDVKFERQTKILDGKTRKELISDLKDYRPLASSEVEDTLSSLIAEKTPEVIIPRRLLINIYNYYMLAQMQMRNHVEVEESDFAGWCEEEDKKTNE